MVITIYNEQYNLAVTFTYQPAWVTKYGYENYNTSIGEYEKIVDENLDWAFTTQSGLRDNLELSAYTDKGAAQIGETYINSEYGPKVFTLGFRPTSYRSVNSLLGAHSVLAAMVAIENAVFDVFIQYNGRTFKNKFFFSDETTIEGGIIAMQSTDEVYWLTDTIEDIWGYFESGHPYITKKLADVLLHGDSNLKLTRNYPVFTLTEPTYTILTRTNWAASNQTDERKLETVRVTNNTTGKYFEVTPPEPVRYITVNTKELLVQDENGNDLIDYTTGEPWVYLQPGNNSLTLSVNGDVQDDVPPSTRFRIRYELRTTVIE